MSHHLPALTIIVPLIAAPLCLLVRGRKPALGFIVAVTWAVFAMAIALIHRVVTEGVVVYRLGDWPSPWGIEYRIDMLGAFVILFVSAMGAAVGTYSTRSIAKELDERQAYLFGTVFLLCLAGLMGIAATGDMFNLFVFLEISALSSYALISLGRRRRALLAAFQYLVTGTIGATFILIGIGLLYMMTGTLNMAEMAEKIQPLEHHRTVLVAFAFLTVGISLKMAFFPLHFWLPNAYASAPSAVTAFLASTATKVSVYIFLRFVFTIFGGAFAFRQLALDAVLMPLAIAGMFIASAVAIFQTDLKRLLAYSSVAQIGYMVLGASLANVAGLTGAIVHMFNHALTKGGLFLAVGCLMHRYGSSKLDDLRGAGRTMPYTSLAIALGGLGLIGVPTTAGFVSKWYLVSGAFDRGLWPVAAMILLSSLLAVVYVWRIVETLYLKEPADPHKTVREAPLPLLIPTLLVIGASLWFGLSTSWSVGFASQAASELLGSHP
ncbi:MAG: monovalent cation/H+ antiporter subunit D family protein [Planctomycetota bacterium]